MKMIDAESPTDCALTRRSFIQRAGISGVGVTVIATLLEGCGDTPPPVANKTPATSTSAEPIQTTDVEFTINTQKHALTIDTRMPLLDLLREKLALTGTKKGCDHGQCGACTVLVNGRTLNSCLALAALHSGSEIQTVEGLGTDTQLHPVQEAFVKHDAFQCGYCTPGQIMSAVALFNEKKTHTPDEIREYMSGNICRCGAYPNIVAAIQDAEKSGSSNSTGEKKV